MFIYRKIWILFSNFNNKLINEIIFGKKINKQKIKK